MKKTSPLLIGGIIIGVIALVVLVTLLARNGMSKRAAPIEPVESITLKGNGISLQIDGSGNAVWQTSEGTRTELWGRDKTSSLFEYYYANWAQNAEVTNGSATVNVGNDELGNAVLAEDGVGGGGGGNGGESILPYSNAHSCRIRWFWWRKWRWGKWWWSKLVHPLEIKLLCGSSNSCTDNYSNAYSR